MQQTSTKKSGSKVVLYPLEKHVCQIIMPKVGVNIEVNIKKTIRWFKLTFLSPNWRSLNPLKGRFNHPKKVTLNHQADMFENKH